MLSAVFLPGHPSTGALFTTAEFEEVQGHFKRDDAHAFTVDVMKGAVNGLIYLRDNIESLQERAPQHARLLHHRP